MLSIHILIVRSLKISTWVLIFFGGYMNTLKRIIKYFSLSEILLWIISVILIVVSFLIFDKVNYLTLIASLIGVTSLIFIAKGNPIGQVLTIAFSFIYGFISFKFKYYGELLTYVGMTMPMAFFALISWLKNPYNGNKTEVKVSHLKKKEPIFIVIMTTIITIAFYFILKAFDTKNIIPSTISVATSFLAVYLTFRRSPLYAIGYAVNDIVLIVLWSLAAVENLSYISVVVCFIAFLANDIYGFINWKKMEKRQSKTE
mgnify:CR=1 FL=1